VVFAGVLLVPWIYAPSPLFAIVVYAISGFFTQFFFIGNQTLMANNTLAEERSSIIGFITTIAGFGGIVAPYVGSELWVQIDPKIPFLISAALAIVVAVPLALIRETKIEASPSLPHTPDHAPYLTDEYREFHLSLKELLDKHRLMTCPECGRVLRETDSYCDSCGRKLT